ncbi:hypothetical protein JHK85_016841 [Glycine max]|nr:hypothetical protein JHK85_016841 [Glycine max]
MNRSSRQSQFPQYSLRTANKSNILDQALVVNILAKPKRANTPPKADHSKRCRSNFKAHKQFPLEYPPRSRSKFKDHEQFPPKYPARLRSNFKAHK